jgi:O-acetyl-ADP-ribose deacetylase (regulator of RNase III)
VIHTVGPIYGRENGNEGRLLASCYQRTLELAETHGIGSIAFPSISTGAFGYPIKDAARIAIRTLKEYLRKGNSRLSRLVFVTFSEEDYRVYIETFEEIFPMEES